MAMWAFKIFLREDPGLSASRGEEVAGTGRGENGRKESTETVPQTKTLDSPLMLSNNNS
jgi:hypothetical protein